MKKRIVLTFVLIAAFMLCLVACKGDKAPESLKVLEGVKTEYQLNETPDFSGIKVLVTYNDGTTKEVGFGELTISTLDTTTVGDKKITIKYEDVVLDMTVKVKGDSIDSAYLTEIVYSSGLPAKIFRGESVNAGALVVLAKYSDGTSATVNGSMLSTNLSTIDFTTAGAKTVEISYQGKSTSFTIEVVEPTVVRIEVDADSIDTVVEAGGVLDLSTIEVYKVYNNGVKVFITRDDKDLDLQKGMPDLSVEGDKEYVIYYQSFSCTLKITTEPPVLESITLGSTLPEFILLGDKLSTVEITAKANFSNNTSKDVANSALVFDYDVSAVGDATVTVSYTLDEITKTATFTVKVLGIKSVAIDTGSVKTSLVVGETIDVAAIKIIITATDDSILTRGAEDGVVIDTQNLDTDTVSETGYISASYRGVASEKLVIKVYDEDTNYIVTGTSVSSSLALLASQKTHFTNSSYGYVVGDDNPFVFTLILSVYKPDGTKVDNLTTYTSASEVFLDGVKLEGDELAKYVIIDEANNSFDFTEEAIGKTFTISTRPRDGVPESKINEFTQSITVTVVDGYNIYKAWELNYITNYSNFTFSDAKVFGETFTMDQVQVVDAFLETKGATRPQSISGIVLHSNLAVTPDDIPAEYFLDKNRANTLWDALSVFSHKNTAENPHFTIYGNYFTINSSALPPVCAQNSGNQEDIVSNAQLFGFDVDPALRGAGAEAFDHTKYSTTVQNLFLSDDNPNSNDEWKSERSMRGLIGMKTWSQIINLDNIRVECFYISLIADSDYQVVNIKDSKYYNSWQNHLFIWSTNRLAEQNDTPIENYPVLTVNAINSSFTKSGGPVIISQIPDPSFPMNAKSGAIINLDEQSKAWTYVAGSEAWFNSMGEGVLGAVANSIKALNPLLQSVGGSFVTTNPPAEAGVSGEEFMNIIAINLTAGMDFETVLNGNVDLDGVVKIGDKTVLDMTDANGLGYANIVVGAIKKAYPQAPVFLSSEGGIGIVNQDASGQYVLITNVYTMLYAAGVNLGIPAEQLAAADAANAAALGYGDYITLYYNNMGLVFAYNMDDATRHALPAALTED